MPTADFIIILLYLGLNCNKGIAGNKIFEKVLAKRIEL